MTDEFEAAIEAEETISGDDASHAEEGGGMRGADHDDAAARASWDAAVALARDCGWYEVVVSDWRSVSSSRVSVGPMRSLVLKG